MLKFNDKGRDELSHLAFAAFVKDAESEAALERYLKMRTLTDVRVSRGDVAAAIAWLKKVKHSPQRLLVDISGSTAPLEELDALANACEPSVQVFVVGDRNDVGLYRNLLRGGVEDYLVKPLNSTLLRRVLSEDSQEGFRKGRHGKVIAVVGSRGGVGVSSIATNLARRLAAGGTRRRVIYMDLDLHDGCGASLLGLAGGNSLIEVLANVQRLDPQYLERTLSTLDNRLFALTAELAYADDFTIAPGTLHDVLATLGQYFHYIVVDTPWRGGALANELFASVNIVSVVSDLSVHSARTLVRLVRHIEALPQAPTVYSVLNHPLPTHNTMVRQQDFLKAVGLPVQVQIGHEPKVASLADNLGEAAPEHSQLAQGVQLLSDLVTGRPVSEAKSSWLRRWPRRKST